MAKNTKTFQNNQTSKNNKIIKKEGLPIGSPFLIATFAGEKKYGANRGITNQSVKLSTIDNTTTPKLTTTLTL